MAQMRATRKSSQAISWPLAHFSHGVGSDDFPDAEQILRRLRFHYTEEKTGFLIAPGLPLTLTNSSPGAHDWSDWQVQDPDRPSEQVRICARCSRMKTNAAQAPDAWKKLPFT